MSDDKRPKRAALPVPPHQRRNKKRKIDVNLKQQTLSEILPTSASSVTVPAEPTNLEQSVDDTVTVVELTKSQLSLDSGISAVSAQGLSVDSTLLSQSEYSLPSSASHGTESGHPTSKPSCKYKGHTQFLLFSAHVPRTSIIYHRTNEIVLLKDFMGGPGGGWGWKQKHYPSKQGPKGGSNKSRYIHVYSTTGKTGHSPRTGEDSSSGTGHSTRTKRKHKTVTRKQQHGELRLIVSLILFIVD
jgi:hypothetical protein